MKIPEECKLKKCVSEDETRERLQGVYITKDEAGKPVAVATTGRILVVVPVELNEDDDVDVIVPIGAIVPADKPNDIKLSGNDIKLSGYAAPETHEYIKGSFPDWKKLWPKHDRPSIKLRINFQLLWDLSKGIGTTDILMEIPIDPETNQVKPFEPLIIKSTSREDRRGLLMPMHKN